MSKRKLNQTQERDVALSHLCYVSPDYITGKWGVREATVRQSIIYRRSKQWNDTLVDFYKEVAGKGNRYANAIHLYLTVNDQLQGLPNTQLINYSRDHNVYEAVNKDIFSPRTEKLIDETNLDAILNPHRTLNPEEKLLRDIFGNRENDERVYDFVHAKLFPRLKEVYGEIASKKTKGLLSESPLDDTYAQVKKDIFGKMRQGLMALEDEVVREVFEARQNTKRSNLHEKIEEVLKTLSYRERELVKLRYGLGDGTSYTLEETGRIFRVARERVRQVEAKAIRKLQQPSHSNILAPFYIKREVVRDKPIEPAEPYQEKTYSEAQAEAMKKPVSDFSHQLSVRTRKVLIRNAIGTIGDVCNVTMDSLLDDKICGITTIQEIREKLLEPLGLNFKPKSE